MPHTTPLANNLHQDLSRWLIVIAAGVVVALCVYVLTRILWPKRTYRRRPDAAVTALRDRMRRDGGTLVVEMERVEVRHRAPKPVDEPDTAPAEPQPAPEPVEHVGATEDCRPLRELMPVEGHLRAAGGDPVPTIAEIEPYVELQLDEWHDLEAAAADGWPVTYGASFAAAMDQFEARLARFEAALAHASPVAAYRRAVAVDETGELDTDALQELLNQTTQLDLAELRALLEDVAVTG